MVGATLRLGKAPKGTLMQRDRLKESLKHLGIHPEDYRVLKLLPLVYVAWADGKIEKAQADRIHDLAVKRYDLSPAALKLLYSWLEKPLTKDQIHEGLHDLYLLATAHDDIEVDFSELPQLLSYCEAIARTTATAMDAPESVSLREDAALHDIARELHIDNGDSWAELLRGLG